MNITNFSFSNLTIYAPKINIKDLYCNQLNDYFVRTGILIVILYIFFSWFNWWFFNYGYIKLNDYFYLKDDINPRVRDFFYNLNKLETRIYWDIFIKDKLSKLMLGYIVVVIYLNL